MSKILQAKNIIKSFECMEQKVLNNVSLEIERGEFVAVMGASGSGKSTLLYAVSGMDAVDAGEISFLDKDITALKEDELASIRRNRMGFVFQQPTLLKNLNLIDNIMFPQMKEQGKQIKELEEKAKLLMEQVGIAGLEARNITQASGGQLQRVGICRALMNEPEIIFADEPTGALNSKSTEEIMSLFQQIHRNGTAIFMVTHDAKVAGRADRVLFMKDGEILNQLSLKDLIELRFGEKIEKVQEIMKRLGI